ncbi:glycosyltransferase [Sporosarcina sp. SAFN-015]|uniref:glycosyltransferase n=1 Tax=Sporosarcina sp. SAFN-015 TaxID=3387274 RepID=UPI003F7D1BA9
MVKVSIIVPIYNVEKYLKRCLISIQNQRLKDIQIILVNDGSKDNSLEICREFEAIDDRVVLIDKPNGGVSSARNAGIMVAEGEYIGFIDPDDWIEPEMFEALYQQGLKNNADICICNYVIEQNEKSIPVIMDIEKEILEGKEIIENIVVNMIGSSNLNSGSQTVMGSACRLIIKKDLIEKYSLSFNVNIPLMEDLLFCVAAFSKARRVQIINGTYYHYFQKASSAIRIYRKNMFEIQSNVFQELEKIIKDNGNTIMYKERLDIRYVNLVLDSISNEVKKGNRKRIKERIITIKRLCENQKLKIIINKINSKGYTIRKKIVLNAIKKEYALFLYFYYSALLKITDIKN